MKSKAITICIVNFNTKTLLQRCLECLQENLQESQVNVCVVDNQSTDGSAEYLRSLDWIHLIERNVSRLESGKEAHGRGLDAGVQEIHTPFLLCIHTDTLIYNQEILEVLRAPMVADPTVACVGSTNQVHRGAVRAGWRLIKRSIQNSFRGLGLMLGLNVKAPRAENQYIRSYCTLWNLDVFKGLGLSFHISDLAPDSPYETPGYLAQDRLLEAGYRVAKLPTREIFKHVDHVHRGTIVGTGGYAEGHRRSKKFHRLVHSSRT